MRLGLTITIVAIAGVATPSRASAQGTATIVGRVSDTTGTAVRHAVLQVAGLSLTVLTDANGGYRFNHVPGGAQRVITRAFEFTPNSESVSLAPGTESGR